MQKSESEYVIEATLYCKSVFQSKMQEYGISWWCMRNRAFLFQIYMKCIRMRSIQDGDTNATNESIKDDFVAIANYGLMWLMKMSEIDNIDAVSDDDFILGDAKTTNGKLLNMYQAQLSTSKSLMETKNTNYKSIWRKFDTETFTDFITVKVYRLMEMSKNDKRIDLDFNAVSIIRDIVNYAFFAIANININNQQQNNDCNGINS